MEADYGIEAWQVRHRVSARPPRTAIRRVMVQQAMIRERHVERQKRLRAAEARKKEEDKREQLRMEMERYGVASPSCMPWESLHPRVHLHRPYRPRRNTGSFWVNCVLPVLPCHCLCCREEELANERNKRRIFRIPSISDTGEATSLVLSVNMSHSHTATSSQQAPSQKLPTSPSNGKRSPDRKSGIRRKSHVLPAAPFRTLSAERRASVAVGKSATPRKSSGLGKDVISFARTASGASNVSDVEEEDEDDGEELVQRIQTDYTDGEAEYLAEARQAYSKAHEEAPAWIFLPQKRAGLGEKRSLSSMLGFKSRGGFADS